MPVMNLSTAAVLGSVLAATSVMSVAPAEHAAAAPAPKVQIARPAEMAVQPLTVTIAPPAAQPAPAVAQPATQPTPVVARPAAPAVSRSSSRIDEVAAAPQASGRLAAALAIARQKLGDPYVYGASGPNAFDCSGLVQFALRNAGFGGVPRTAAAQAAMARRIDRTALQPGDLIFFSRGGNVYHVGFFVGWSNGTAMILHAPEPGSPVQISTVWTNSWFAGTLS